MKLCLNCSKQLVGENWYIKKHKFCSCSCYHMSHLGKSTITEEGRRKLSEAKLGDKNPAKRKEIRKKISDSNKNPSSETRAKMSLAAKKRIGSLNSNWRGGITPRRLTDAYKVWRLKVMKRDDYTCQICGKRGGKLQVDHIKSYSLYPELIMEMSNGRTLCVSCHRKTDTYGGFSRKKRSSL